MEQVISELPPSAYVIFVISLAVIYAVQRFGLWQGQNTEPASDKALVASVIVDPSALNHLSDEVKALRMAILDVVEVGKEMAKTESHMAIELDRIREEMRIQREISRRG